MHTFCMHIHPMLSCTLHYGSGGMTIHLSVMYTSIEHKTNEKCIYWGNSETCWHWCRGCSESHCLVLWWLLLWCRTPAGQAQSQTVALQTAGWVRVCLLNLASPLLKQGSIKQWWRGGINTTDIMTTSRTNMQIWVKNTFLQMELIYASFVFLFSYFPSFVLWNFIPICLNKYPLKPSTPYSTLALTQL